MILASFMKQNANTSWKDGKFCTALVASMLKTLQGLRYRPGDTKDPPWLSYKEEDGHQMDVVFHKAC